MRFFCNHHRAANACVYSSLFLIIFAALPCFTTPAVAGDWTVTQLDKLTASDAAAVDRFGRSAAISGNTAIVGAPYDDDGGSEFGSAYLYNATTGTQLANLTASDLDTAGGRFGCSVAISGNIAIIGAEGNNPAGSAYLFDITNGNQLAKLTTTDVAPYSAFGYSVAISGNTAIIGAPYDDEGGLGSGSAYLFDITTGNQVAKLLRDQRLWKLVLRLPL